MMAGEAVQIQTGGKEMKRSFSVTIMGFVLVVGVLRLPANAQVVSYTFTKIADCSDDSITVPDSGGVSINAQGAVAFIGNLNAGGQGVFTGNGGPLTTIVDTNQGFGSFGPFANFGGQVSINDNGTVAFFGQFQAGGAGIFSGRGGPLTLLADTSGVLSGIVGTAAINNQGTVAFVAGFRASGRQGILTSDHGTLITIADSGSFAGGFGAIPAINARGTVAFWGMRSAS